MSLRDLRNKHSDLIQKIADDTSLYAVPIIYPRKNEVNTQAPFGGSGLLSFIGKRAGILTNDHVAQLVRLEDPSYIYLPFPYPQLGLLSIKILKIISLPNTQNGGIDLAFIEFDTSSISITEISKNLGKKFWDLDSSYSDYLSDVIQINMCYSD